MAAEVQALVDTGQRDTARERFGVLVGLLQRRATRLACAYLGDPADADEAVQDAFVRLFLHIGAYRSGHPVEPWFTRMVVTACLDRLRSRTRRRWLALASDDAATLRAVDTTASAAPGAEAQLLRTEQLGRIAREMRQLPARQRLVVTLAHAGGLTASEIAEVTGMAPATVRVHLFRALARLRHLLGVTA